MRAAAVALVLVVGAAIVLWYGNTLNSWVLAGLIGGLAALLLSIPITLLIFAQISRRHAERFDSIDEARVSPTRAQARAYAMQSQHIEEDEYEVDAQQYRSLASWAEYEEYYAGQRMPSQRLPVPVRTQNRLPAPQVARQQYLPAPRAERASQYLAPGDEWYYDDAPAPAQRTMYTRSAAQGRGSYSPESAGMSYGDYPANGEYSQRQFDPSRASRRPTERPIQRDSQHLPATTRRTSRNLVDPQMYTRSAGQRSGQPPTQYKPQHTVDGSSMRQAPNQRALPPGGNNGNRSSLPVNEPRTDQIGRRSSQTLPYRQLPSGQLARRPQVEGTRRNADIPSGPLTNPLVRRAPYMYEDDPLREELSQQVSTPLVRRSSRSFDFSADED